MPISISDPRALKPALLERAREAGFDDIGFLRVDARPDLPAALQSWLADGRHGDMAWMAETAARRSDPATLWPEARSIIMLAMTYGPDENPLDLLEQKTSGAISVYARNRDYHDLIKTRLKQVARWLAETSGAEVKVFVDTAPVMEKPLAEAAGLGWQGKHTNLVSRKLGSWFFLGSIFTTLEFEPDTRHEDHCGQCSNCLDVCPTKAFPKPYELDARRCLSYLSIEFKGHIPSEFRKPMGNRIYGCDDCLAVCPWNKFAMAASEVALRPRDELRAPSLADLAGLDDPMFRSFFTASPVKRIGRDRFIRNVLIAMGNSGDEALAHQVRHLMADPSPLVRAMAVWAMGELKGAEALAALAGDYLTAETDGDVRAEWQAYGVAVDGTSAR
ncbi:MAG: tRNA epoxyqueuosine(34) reductase QueG [Rhizobiales bacterium]|nr:tRNA epoxyqueuosine(34) reductase QueG [Hyphomicrobiales bacterium]